MDFNDLPKSDIDAVMMGWNNLSESMQMLHDIGKLLKTHNSPIFPSKVLEIAIAGLQESSKIFAAIEEKYPSLLPMEVHIHKITKGDKEEDMPPTQLK